MSVQISKTDEKREKMFHEALTTIIDEFGYNVTKPTTTIFVNHLTVGGWYLPKFLHWRPFATKLCNFEACYVDDGYVELRVYSAVYLKEVVRFAGIVSSEMRKRGFDVNIQVKEAY